MLSNDLSNDDSFVATSSFDCPKLQSSSFFNLSTSPPSSPESGNSIRVAVSEPDAPKAPFEVTAEFSMSALSSYASWFYKKNLKNLSRVNFTDLS